MRFRFFQLLLVSLLFSLSACRNEGKRDLPEWEKALLELDRTLSRETAIDRRLEDRVDSLRVILTLRQDTRARYRLYDEIFDCYYKYDLDSALAFAHRKEVLARQVKDPDYLLDATLDIAQRYLISGMYYEAQEVVSAVDTTAIHTPRQRATYYQTLHSIFHGLALTVKDKVLSLRFREAETRYQQLSHAAMQKDMIDYYTVIAGIEIENGRSAEARQLLNGYLDSGRNLSLPDQSILHYWIAKTYREEGDTDHEILHYAISANDDQIAPVKASRSLIHLSGILYDRGDFERAYRYIVRAYEDATRADARVALNEINQSFPEIIDAYDQVERSKKRQLEVFLGVTFLLLTILAAFLVLLYQDRQRIGRMQRVILESVERLKESNQIKDTYLGRYLSMFSEHIDALERYRSGLRVTAKSKDLDDILRALKSDAYIDTERKTLYDEFDATFLGVFPDFVGQLNGLLREDARIGQDLPPGKLSNELRIFALIRLGVTESAKIAQFLKKSPSTIYNYRVKLRNAAVCDRDAFEKKLMEIGNPG